MEKFALEGKIPVRPRRLLRGRVGLLCAFATHNMIVRTADWSRRYLVHIYRSEVDFRGGLARSASASRIRKDGPAVLEAARYRLSAVDPPSP